MELDDVKTAWRLQECGTGEAYRLDAERTVRRMERARRGQRLVLVCSTAMTLASTVFIGVAKARHAAMDWRSVWPVVLVQVLLVQVVLILTLAVLLRMRTRRQRGYERCGAPVREALVWAVAEIHRQVREMKLMAVGALVVTPLVGLQVAKLFESGRMNARAVESLSVLFVAVLAVNGLVLVRRFCNTLCSERRRLVAILAEL